MDFSLGRSSSDLFSCSGSLASPSPSLSSPPSETFGFVFSSFTQVSVCPFVFIKLLFSGMQIFQLSLSLPAWMVLSSTMRTSEIFLTLCRNISNLRCFIPKFEICRHTFALQKIGAVAASHRDTAEALGETSGRVKELQVLISFQALNLIERVKELQVLVLF